MELSEDMKQIAPKNDAVHAKFEEYNGKEKNMEKSKLKSAGVYSVLKKKWIKEPTQEEIPDIDEEAFEKLYKEWEDRYFDLIDEVADDKENLTESLTAAQKQKLSVVLDYLEQNDFIDVHNCTDDTLALQDIDENLVEELKAMFGKSTVISHFAAVLEAHTLETLMNLGLFTGTAIKSITIPNSVTSIGDNAFSWCESLTSITIPNSVTSIGISAFGNCASLASITIPNSVTSIGDGAFECCGSLTSITIPNSVTSIGDKVFECCSSLTSITIPNSVTSIGDGAFECCGSLTSVDIPNSVTSISNGAFSNCASLTSITIPNSVKAIGSYAFSYCDSLKSIILEKGIDKSVEDQLRKEYGMKVKLQESLAESKERPDMDRYYLVDILCSPYFKNGEIENDAEFYAKNDKDLLIQVNNYVRQTYGKAYYHNATKYGPLSYRIK